MNSLSPARKAYLLSVRRQKRQVRLWQIALLAGLLLLWELSCRLGLSDGFLISSPSRMATTFLSLCRSGDLWRHIGVSCGETVVGFLSGTALGTAVAICMWWSEKLAKILDPYLVVLNAPTLFSTLKVNVGLSWVGVIMGEFLVSQAGLGYLIVYGSQVFNMDLVMTSVVILAAAAVVMYQLVLWVEKILNRFWGKGS